MGEKKEEDLYRNFSRKDLQGLCKKYGLPANKSNSEMATSLILYLERKNICSKSIWEVARSDPNPSELQPRVGMNSDGDKRADSRATSSHNGFGLFRKHRNPDKKDIRCGKGPSSHKASDDMGLLTKLHRDSNSGAGDAENVFSSVLSSTAEASLPSFTFDVSCEDGIQLCVDLNSTPSDWVESMKAGLHICHDIHDLESSGCDDRKGSFLMEEDESCPTTVGTGVVLQADESRRPEFFRNTVHNLENLGKERATLSCLPKSETQQLNHGSECLIRKECEVDTTSYASVLTQIRTNNFSGKTVPYDPTCSKTGDAVYKEPHSQQICTSADRVFKNSILSGTPFAGIKASPSVSFFHPHDIASSSSMVATCLVSADRPQNSGIVQFGSFDSVNFRGDVPQMWPFQAIDRTQYASSSYFVSGLSDAGQQARTEHGRASKSSKCIQIPEAQAQFFRSCEKSMSFVPYQNLPLTIVNRDTNIRAGNGGIISSNEARQVAVELPTKDASLNPFNFGGPLDLGVPKKNKLDLPIIDYANNLDEDVCRSQVRSNLGTSKDGDGNKRSAFKAFRQAEESRLKPANSDRSQFKMKSHFNSFDNRCQSESPVAKILRTPKQFSGDARASRRRSTRPFTK
ncbi:hypothetical protein RND81_05G123300 [Saponaria officinalis]|uniref:Uncharacterized protein n=1 Tax=Saponaria officinalis TaxID=3572 RepID=A0AAW1KW94_SAPOF